MTCSPATRPGRSTRSWWEPRRQTSTGRWRGSPLARFRCSACSWACAHSRPRMLDPDVRLLDWGLRGFTVLAQRPGSELVIGGPGQPWRLAGGVSARVGSLAEFRAFDRPGFAKLALSFRLERAPVGTRVITETRVDTTDPLAHRRFRAYWQVIRIGSGAIRRNWLRAIKRRAERAPAATAAPTR